MQIANHMKIFLTYILILINAIAFAQNKKIEDPTVAVYKLLSDESIHIKDSLVIYALNFELDISKKNGKVVVTHIAANDSLAFTLFPSYKKLSNIDFTLYIGAKNNIKLIIPILIYGSSPEKMIYKDKAGNPLISFNAAVNAAYALYSPFKYNNNKDSEVELGHRLFKETLLKKQKVNPWDIVFMSPITLRIMNIR